MFALSDARDYSFSKVPYLEREEKITVQNLNLKSSQKVMCVMNVRSIKLEFSLNFVVTIVF